MTLADAADAAFSSASRGDIRGPLLWLALIARHSGSRAGERLEAPGVTLKPVLDAFASAPAVRDLPERLPGRGETLRLGGLPGSSGAVLAAWLVQTFPSDSSPS